MNASEKTNMLLSALIAQMAPQFNVNPDHVSAIANGTIRALKVSRYTQDGVIKYLVMLDNSFLVALRAIDVGAMKEIIGRALSMLNSAQTTVVKTPVIVVNDYDFEYEYVTRAVHRPTGISVTTTNSRPDYLSMKSTIHEEIATIVGILIQES